MSLLEYRKVHICTQKSLYVQLFVILLINSMIHSSLIFVLFYSTSFALKCLWKEAKHLSFVHLKCHVGIFDQISLQHKQPSPSSGFSKVIF